MSEYQNRAVEWLLAGSEAAEVMDRTMRRKRFLEEALGLYQAMGGSAEEARGQVARLFAKPAGEVVADIGDVMIELAGISFAYDVDMMQAAYNTLDFNWKNSQTKSVNTG